MNTYQNILTETHLYCDNYPSDKIYIVSVLKQPLSNLYDVQFAYGRRKQTLKQGYKIGSASQSVANSVASKLIQSKLNKGYRREDKGYSINDPEVVYRNYLQKLYDSNAITKEQLNNVMKMIDSSDQESNNLAEVIISAKESIWAQS
jgi:hypothetical protein